ncbi:Alpha/beta hydrolase fold [Trema orientale]|uniref:Alpha/beta hydrolase fold n=1 Tax=Trema orientale TaxID=63057 RepID=A0A2P5ER82_TREOI|nr:Alpha/beta hydrolase fold [Trema orientale]
MSDQTIDPYQRLQIVRNDDGTITRLLKLPDTPASPDPTLPNSPDVLSKDVHLDQSKSTWVRIYLPRHALDNSSTSSSSKLPLVVNFHGGGFITFSASSSLVHDFALNSAAQLSAVVVSVEYRLAPEHRLPAAYEDAMDALHCIRSAEDDWLRRYADLSQCFLMGGIAGANIAYHAGLRAAAEAQSLEPIKIRGLILHQPFFGGAQRSGSELRLVNDPVLPLC